MAPMSIKLRLLFFVFVVFAMAPAFSAGVDEAANTITISMLEDPPTLDSSLVEDQVSNFAVRTIQDQLVHVDSRGRVTPGVAESWELNEKGATFHLRRDARWSDGQPVTAHDFVYAWRRLVDPATGASGSTFLAFVFKNAEAILRGEKPKGSLGVRAVDDYTLEVVTSRPIPFLLEVLSSGVYSPLRQDIVEAAGQRYAAEPSTMVYSGPFVLKDWTRSSSLSFERNPYYWDQASVSLDRINVGYITSDRRALLNLYKSKQLATVTINNTIIEDAAELGFRIRKQPNNCWSMITLNFRDNRPTANRNLRKSLQYSFDAETYAYRVIAMPGSSPLQSVFSSDIMGEGVPFTRQFPPATPDRNLEKAKQYFAEAVTELGGMPTLVLLSREGNEKQDEYLQSLFMQSLGLELKIDRQSFKQAIERLINGEFDLAFSAFCNGTISDPFITAQTFVSTNSFNDGRYSSTHYDALHESTLHEPDMAKRLQAFAEMQALLIDDVVALPTHETSDIYLQDQRVQRLMYGAVRNFSEARIRR